MIDLGLWVRSPDGQCRTAGAMAASEPALSAEDDVEEARSDEERETPPEALTVSGRRRRPKQQSRAERELGALWVEINVHKAARDKLYVELKSLQGSIEAAKSSTAGKGAGKVKFSTLKAQIRVRIRNECNALDALHARKDEICVAIKVRKKAASVRS